MRIILTVLAALVIAFAGSSTASAQPYVDTASFTISALIKPSDHAAWPDSLGAWKVYATFDIDKDGKKEFLVLCDPPTSGAGRLNPSIYRFEATGNNSYAMVWNTTIPDSNRGSFFYPDLTVGDLDGDGNLEVHVLAVISGRATENPNSNPARLYAFEYDPGTGNLPAEASLTSNLQLRDFMRYHGTRIVIANTDTDADVEVVVTSRSDDFGGLGSGRTLQVFHLVGDVGSPFSSLEREFIDSSAVLKGGAVYDLGVVDFDGDGKSEIWVATWDLLSLAIYEATGANTYALQADINEAEGGDIGFRSSMKFFDANKDGKLEMFAAGITGDGDNPGAVYYIGNVNDVSTLDTGSVQPISPWVDGAEHDSWSLEGGDVGDVDGDGKVDYFAVGAGPLHRNLYRLEYKSGAYNDAASYSWDSVYHATLDSTYDFRNVVIADDLDGDGKKEVLLANVKTRAGTTDPAVIILESKVVVVSVQQLSDAVPAAFTLGQNYPNPFNPTSTIQFALQTAGQTELIVTNTLGQRVASLVNGQLAAGTHQVTFDASGLSSGTYFYTLKSGSKIETKKMMLMK